jgi:nucleotide-binding universal stress UspA family protein
VRKGLSPVSAAHDLDRARICGGIRLPARRTRCHRFTNEQQAWWDELLDSISAEILTKARNRARTAGAITVQLESRRGDVATTILDIARDKEADAIVVGKHGASGIARLLLGSVSRKLVSIANRPVTVIP